jgi:hypothetical protein
MTDHGVSRFHAGVALKNNYDSSTWVNLDINAEPTATWTFRIPNDPPASTSQLVINSSGAISYQAVGGGGTVTSVGLSLPSIFSVSNSPVTLSGTLTATLSTQSANTVFIAPDGSTGAPTFRSLVANDIPTLTAAKISNFDTQVRASRLDQMTAPTASVALNSQKITGLAEPTQAQDAATKNYVDTAVVGATIYKGTADGSAATPAAATGTAVFANGHMYRINVAGNTAFGFQVNIGDFVIYNGTGWNKIDATDPAVSGTSNRVTVTSTGDTSYTVDIASTYVGQNTITTLGTIATGTWQGTAIALANGGTGATTQSGARANLAAAGVASGTFNSSNLVSGQLAITHNLGNQYPGAVAIYDNNGELVSPDKGTGTSTSVYTVDLTTFNSPTPISGTWRWTVVG